MKYEGKRIIGITGGIGSGKTKVLELIKNNYDVQVIEADKIGHELQQPGEAVYKRIVAEFGEDIITDTNEINRKKLGEIVFADDKKLRLLNKITHPAIHEHIEAMIKFSTHKLIFIEAAILTETSLVELVDEMWYIYAEKSIRFERLKKYRNISGDKAEKIMSSQPDEAYFRRKCDVIIDNSNTEKETLKQIKIYLDKPQEEHYE